MEPLRKTREHTAVPASSRLRICPPSHSLSPAALDRFAGGEASGEERRAVIRHLLDGCRDCQHHLQSWWGGSEPSFEADYDRALDRGLAIARQTLVM